MPATFAAFDWAAAVIADAVSHKTNGINMKYVLLRFKTAPSLRSLECFLVSLEAGLQPAQCGTPFSESV